MIKIDKSITKWLGKVVGRDGINHVVLYLTTDGIQIRQFDDVRYQWIEGHLAREDTSIVEYSIPEKTEIELPIPDIRTFVDIIKSFDDLITVIPEKTYVVLKTAENKQKNKEVKYQFINPKMIPHYEDDPIKTKFMHTYEISTSFLKDVQKDIQALSGQAVQFIHKGKELLVKIEGGNHKITETTETEGEFDGEARIHAKLTDQLIRTLSEEVVIIGFSDNSYSLMFSEIVTKDKTPLWYMSNVITSVEDETD